MTVRIIQADCRIALAEMADDSVHCVVTSPPYHGLRNYGVDGQIGLEPTLQEWLCVMKSVFADLHRVLRADGTAWVNIGDKFVSKQRVLMPERLGIMLQ